MNCLELSINSPLIYRFQLWAKWGEVTKNYFFFSRRGSLRANRIQAQEKLSRPTGANEPRSAIGPEDRLGRPEERLGRPDERLGRLDERLGRLTQRILSDNQLNATRPAQEKSIFPSFENLKVGLCILK